MSEYPLAPEWHVSLWFNTGQPMSLADLHGKVVVLHAFQMLCPGCVSHAIPQAERLHRLLQGEDAVVVGLHTVFEHHTAMTPVSLKAFLHEYRITHPIGVDNPRAGSAIPESMRAYGFQGTPSLLLIDREGRIRHQSFGRTDDLALGLMIGRLLAETPASLKLAETGNGNNDVDKEGCDEGSCAKSCMTDGDRMC